MLFNGLGFKALKSGLDASWMKQKIHQDNISNYETPGYKAKKMNFEDVLSGSEFAKEGVKHEFTATVSRDESLSMRPDGNNVDIDRENMELWKSYNQYSALTSKISGQFKNMRYVINQALK